MGRGSKFVYICSLTNISFAPPPVTSSAVIIPYKVGGGANETFYHFSFICSASPAFFTIFVSFAPPLPPILTHKVTHEEKNSILVFDRGKQKLTQKSTFPV